MGIFDRANSDSKFMEHNIICDDTCDYEFEIHMRQNHRNEGNKS